MKTLQYNISLDGSRGERKKKIRCEYCGHKDCFTRYKDYSTGLYLDDKVGLCDRINKCGAHVTPKEFFDKLPKPIYPTSSSLDNLIERPVVNIPVEILKSTLHNYESNSFINSLVPFFSKESLEKAIADYFIGTINAGFNAEDPNCNTTVFWFINRANEVRAGQIKLFDSMCHTAKYINREGERKPVQTWIHSILTKRYRESRSNIPDWLKQYSDGTKVNCLFGEHLLEVYKEKVIGLVESPKTAVVASLCYPNMIWLATSSLTYLTKERCKVLKGRKVILFPDCGIPNPKTGKTCLDLWKERISDFQEIADFKFSTLLEERTTRAEKESGFDLADLLLREARKQPIKLLTRNILSIPIDIRTGPDFGNLVIATIWMKDDVCYDLLCDKEGDIITSHERIGALEKFFEKNFIRASIDDTPCLISLVKN